MEMFYEGHLLYYMCMLAGCISLLSILAILLFPYKNLVIKISRLVGSILFAIAFFFLMYGNKVEKLDEIVTKEETPIEYSIVKGKTEVHVSGGGVHMFTAYSFTIDTNNVFSFYYQEADNSYKKESIVMDENFYIKEIDEDKCYIEVCNTSFFTQYKSKFLGTIEVENGKDTIVYLYVPIGTLSSGEELILD